jgi:hypothetical protein
VETKVGDVFASTFATYSDPRVRSAGPAGGTLQRFRISFSQDMDPETLTANTLRVFDDGAETPAVISWEGGARHELELALGYTPKSGSHLVVLLGEGIAAADGTPMADLPREVVLSR